MGIMERGTFKRSSIGSNQHHSHVYNCLTEQCGCMSSGGYEDEPGTVLRELSVEGMKIFCFPRLLQPLPLFGCCFEAQLFPINIPYLISCLC
jgi:hypothetical protein